MHEPRYVDRCLLNYRRAGVVKGLERRGAGGALQFEASLLLKDYHGQRQWYKTRPSSSPSSGPCIRLLRMYDGICVRRGGYVRQENDEITSAKGFFSDGYLDLVLSLSR
jgi:hypothetical protein